MRMNIVFGIFCMGLSTHHLIGSHEKFISASVQRLPTFEHRTVFRSTSPEIIENNIIAFYNQNEDSIKALEAGGASIAVGMQFSAEQREHLKSIWMGRGNIVRDFREARRQFQLDLQAYIYSVWNKDNPYQPTRFSELKSLKQALNKALLQIVKRGKIIEDLVAIFKKRTSYQ